MVDYQRSRIAVRKIMDCSTALSMLLPNPSCVRNLKPLMVSEIWANPKISVVLSARNPVSDFY